MTPHTVTPSFARDVDVPSAWCRSQRTSERDGHRFLLLRIMCESGNYTPVSNPWAMKPLVVERAAEQKTYASVENNRPGHLAARPERCLTAVRVAYLCATKYWLNGLAMASFSKREKPASSATRRTFAGPIQAPYPAPPCASDAVMHWSMLTE